MSNLNLEDKKNHNVVHDEYLADDKKDGVHDSFADGVKGEVEVQQVFSESYTSLSLPLYSLLVREGDGRFEARRLRRRKEGRRHAQLELSRATRDEPACAGSTSSSVPLKN